MSDSVLVDVEDRIAVITVNDPDRRNAVTFEMSAALREAVTAAETDPEVHAVIVTGAGKAFCAGADLSALGSATADGLRKIYDGFLAVADCTLPTIAAVNGAAVGAGLNLALAADVRIAGPAALFDPRFQKLGIHPGGGATWMLQRLVGPQAARAALLFGMRFDAEAAVRHGLALEIADDPVAAAKALAAGPAGAPRDVVLATKASMRATANPGVVDSDQHRLAVDIEIGPQAASIESPEFQQRLAAARKK
ncbi:enoyl-CoA hydratase/isomerase [Mycolicibacterium phlei]|uniref:Enoyl-CoA hydratase n=1 Tax=Mycolicibacterium phlei DSM 43239 = CCUG 21000 TaxID=1226750 RepID=A0A5N5UN31_MYCPH|nr:enoyl-CoA hydratase [Mycolicibacterium phlei]VEG10557.1 enoyl-CoA hydratase/isomerase [Mycobacteroides chelonae]AMO62456.1 putative enoyl-CoA hydratase echA14 [Mycolicibacterium phlei]KAB7750996.1 enoyl-CoA hydratase [Mycolicibacterium phlei DSM 43239 = CCUG 21000]KXW61627.1 enoyl-CoA hydratase [Mycolicibacterium phlei DSM 43239 = CCUG 21000]KXW71275.1 enoyl-CoA hydratase [Mycolicibacterium phlei DSM 43072]